MDRASIAAALERAAAPGPPRLEVIVGVGAAGSRPAGLVPGSFDPVTVAHVALAEALIDQGVAPVSFVFSSRTLAKEGRSGASPPLLPAERRLDLLAAVCRDRGLGMAVCSHGLLVDQAAAAAAAFGTEVVLGVGSDKLGQVFDPAWYDDRDVALERLFDRAQLAYAVRAGDEDAVAVLLRSEPRWAGRVRRLPVPAAVAGISSSEVRERLRAGEEVTGLVPAEAVTFLG